MWTNVGSYVAKAGQNMGPMFVQFGSNLYVRFLCFGKFGTASDILVLLFFLAGGGYVKICRNWTTFGPVLATL